MFINTGGLPEQHIHGDKQHLQPQHDHHHGPRDLQQFGQLHHRHRSRRLAARRHPLLPDPPRHGSLFPAALLLKPRPRKPPPPTTTTTNLPPFYFFSASALLLTSHPIIPPSPASLLSLSQRPQD